MKVQSLTVYEFEKLVHEACTIIDLRDTSLFAEEFIPGSINIPLDKDFDSIAPYFIFRDQALLLLTEAGSEEESVAVLQKKKYTNIKGFLKGGFQAWLQAGKAIDVVISITDEELLLEIRHGKLDYIDLRPADEYVLKHLPFSENTGVAELANEPDKISNAVTTCIYCSNGKLSMALISYLKSCKRHNFYHVAGGFESIRDNKDIELMSSKKKEG
jgi:rhodanese-related sulfurtransferase